MSRFIVGLDAGTTKVSAMVGLVEGGRLEVIGAAHAPSNGIRKGVVVDMDAAAGAIRQVADEAARSSGVELKAAYVGISGDHIKCQKGYGATGVKGREVTRKDVDRVVEAASAMYVPLDREVLHVLPSDFTIDGQGGIMNPEGMAGYRLEAEVNIITASQAAVENLVRCCERAGLRVVEAVAGYLASSYGAARHEELDLGVVVMDIGGGTTDVALFKGGGLRQAMVLPLGGANVTNDIGIGLRVSHAEAEGLKKRFGNALPDEDGSEIDVVGMDMGRIRVPRSFLSRIIMPRCEEMFQFVADGIKDSVFLHTPSCVVLTGGGAGLRGAGRVAEAALGLPVRMGAPERVQGVFIEEDLMDPAFSASVGLLMHGYREEKGAGGELLDRVRGGFGAMRKMFSGLNGWGWGAGKSQAC